MAELSLYLLGCPRLALGGEPLEIRRSKAIALLVYLAVSGERQPRNTLATLLWPEDSQQSARKALRRDLSELNLALGREWLDADRTSVGLHDGYWMDVEQFERKLAPESDDPAILMSAADLYRDDFLTGFTLSDCPGFDEWQFFQSEHLRQSLASALERLVRILQCQENYAPAIAYARRWLALDPLHEPAHQQLMLLYAQAGQQSAALRQYQVCRQTLQDELDVEPAEETNALFGAIRRGKLQAAGASPSASRRRRANHNLPTQTTTFVGRETELAEIRHLLLEETDCRLLNLCGPGGIGKTRLALVAAAQSIDAFPDGVYFISLAPVGEVEDIVPAMADAVRVTFFGNIDPKMQLLNYLSERRLLLVVDNFEHLLAATNFLSDILLHAPDVTLLTTSRERLQLQEEWVYEVPGLAYPRMENAETFLGVASFQKGAYSAIELFMQRARQMSPNFAPTVDEMTDISRICALVAGMPLALELAAPWIRTLSCREIAAEIENSLEFLITTLRNMPERHRSLRAVFEQTWRRLPDDEKVVLQQLSVFRGGCTRESAERVTGATLPALSSLLMDRALLRRTSTGRYEMHELIRQFAEAKLRRDLQMVEQVRQRHRDYFVAFLEARTAGVKGPAQVATLAEIEADIDNVRLAWRGAVESQVSEAIERCAECLFVHYLYRNGYDEGMLEFDRALKAFGVRSDEAEDDSRLLDLAVSEHDQPLIGFLLMSEGYFVAHRRDLRKGQRILERALAFIQRTAPVTPRIEAFALLWLGWAHYFQGQLSAGKRYAEESIILLRESGDQWGEGWALCLLGGCLRDGRPAEATAVYQYGVTLCQKSGDKIVLSYNSFNLGAAVTALGHYGQAQKHIDPAVAISENFSNMLGLGYALFYRGRMEIALGKYLQAVQTLRQAWTHFNKVGTVHSSRAQVYLGRAHHLLGDYDRAMVLYRQSLDGLKAANSILDFAFCLGCLGRLAYDRGNLHQAEQYQRESLARLEATEPQPAMVAVTLVSLSQVLVGAGEPRHVEARKCFRHALELALEHELAPIVLDVCVLVAQLLTQSGDLAQALELLSVAESHEASTFDTREQARGYLLELQDVSPVEERQRLDWQQVAKRLIDAL